MAGSALMPSDPKRGQLAPMETTLRANLDNCHRVLETVGVGIQEKLSAAKDPALSSWHTIIYRTIAEMDSAKNDLHVLADDLAASKVDAEYREVLVRAWPANHFLDRMTYIG